MRELLLPGLVAAVLLGACATESPPGSAPSSEQPPEQASAPALDRKLRASQVLMPAIETLDPADARAIVRQTKPGGLILLAPGTAAQWGHVVRAAQNEAKRQGLPPLLIATDQENGDLVRRMRTPVDLPGAMALGAAVAADRESGMQVAEDVAELTGRWLAAAGVNIDFAPVADVNVRAENPVIGIRSPGAYPRVVADAVVGQVAGFTAANVLATAKHFPGHGDTATDSHLGVAEVTHSRGRMARVDLPPFEAAVAADVPAIMVAHVTVPAIDDRPATVSRPVVTGLLRQELGYDGLVVSDALNMGAVVDRPDLAVEVLRAGVDLLVMPADPEEAASSLREALETGDLSSQRLDEAVEHILRAKQRLGLLTQQPVYPDPPAVAESRRVARSAASAGVTVLGSCEVLVGEGVTVIGSGPAADGVRSGLRSAGVGSGPVRVVVGAADPGAADVWVATGSPYGALRAAAAQRVLTYGDVETSGWAAGRAIAGALGQLGGLPVKGPRACVRLR